MQLFVPHIHRSSYASRRYPAFADELMVKIHVLRGCFLGNTLPLPMGKVIDAWNDVPNITVDAMTMFTKTGGEALRVPPPTPTEFAFDVDGFASSDTSSDASHENDDKQPPVDDTIHSTSDAGALQALEGPATGENDSMSRCYHPDQPLDTQTNEEGSLRSLNNHSPSSDENSLSSSVEGSPMPAGFEDMVYQWLLDYRTRGTDAFVESLIAFAVISVGTAQQVSRIARSMVQKLVKVSLTEGRDLENAIRFTALAVFKKCWERDASLEGSSTQAQTTPPTPSSINVASFMGSLFDQKISTAKDIHLCLNLLLEGEKRFDRLCGMHALLAQANDKLCKNRNLPFLMQFKDSLANMGKESGEYLWVTGPHSKAILIDIIDLIDRWVASQEIKREMSRMYFGTGHRTIRNSAVGPRLRNGPLTSCLAMLVSDGLGK